ncbi:MAG: DUF4249 domain-containing protein [Bacteroidetes bacterium]|nr:DUF4249 domain-containing protein [Bacteroidota bacterium]
MKIKLYTLALFAWIGLSSCEKLVTNIDPPKTEKKLVLFTFLSPEEKIRVDLSWSRPVFGSGSSSDIVYEPGAEVVLSSSEGLVDTLVFDEIKQYYYSSKGSLIKPGVTYTVSAKKGAVQVKGSTTIPVNPIPLSLVDYQRVYDPNSGTRIRIKSEWKDPGNEVYYYRTYNEFTFISDFSGDTTAYELCGKYVQNTGKEGEMLVNTCESYDNSWQGSTKTWIGAYLLTCDKAYYEYHRRRENYYGDDPFSEPFPQYSNVEGGLGVVASFRKSFKLLSLQ